MFEQNRNPITVVLQVHSVRKLGIHAEQNIGAAMRKLFSTCKVSRTHCSEAAQTFRQLLPSGEICCVHSEESFNVKDYPCGVYSALRTMDGGRKLGEINKHIQRLLLSARERFGEEFGDDVQRALANSFLPFIRHIAQTTPAGDKDRRYTMVLDRAEAGNFQVLCSSNEINPPPLSVQVELQRRCRHNPQVKSVEWAIEREAAEKSKKESVLKLITRRCCNLTVTCVQNQQRSHSH